MVVHLAEPWIVARVMPGLVASGLALAAAWGALGALRGLRSNGPADARTLALEQRSELVSTALSAAFGTELLATVFTVLAAHGLAPSLRGAMCAYGVLGSSEWGARAGVTAGVAAVGCGVWRGVHRVDVRLPQGSLVRLSSGLALAVIPLVWLDTAVGVRFFTGLDLDTASTCCSVSMDRAGAGFAMAMGTPLVTGVTALGAAGVAVGLSVVLARTVTVRRAVALALWTPVAGWLTLRAAADVVSPYVWSQPAHRCGYCLLRPEAGPAGWLLWGAWALAVITGAGVWGVLPVLRRGTAARTAAGEVLREQGVTAAWAWGVVMAAGLWPVLRTITVTHTVSPWR